MQVDSALTVYSSLTYQAGPVCTQIFQNHVKSFVMLNEVKRHDTAPLWVLHVVKNDRKASLHILQCSRRLHEVWISVIPERNKKIGK